MCGFGQASPLREVEVEEDEDEEAREREKGSINEMPSSSRSRMKNNSFLISSFLDAVMKAGEV